MQIILVLWERKLVAPSCSKLDTGVGAKVNTFERLPSQQYTISTRTFFIYRSCRCDNFLDLSERRGCRQISGYYNCTSLSMQRIGRFGALSVGIKNWRRLVNSACQTENVVTWLPIAWILAVFLVACSRERHLNQIHYTKFTLLLGIVVPTCNCTSHIC